MNLSCTSAAGRLAAAMAAGAGKRRHPLRQTHERQNKYLWRRRLLQSCKSKQYDDLLVLFLLRRGTRCWPLAQPQVVESGVVKEEDSAAGDWEDGGEGDYGGASLGHSLP